MKYGPIYYQITLYSIYTAKFKKTIPSFSLRYETNSYLNLDSNTLIMELCEICNMDLNKTEINLIIMIASYQFIYLTIIQ